MEHSGGHWLNSSVLIPQPRTAPRMLGWNIPASELSTVPDHWFQFEDPPPLLNYTLGLLYLIFFFMSIIGNGLVIWIFTCAKSLRTPSNYFVVMLAICDFIMMLKTPIMIYNSLHLGYSLGHLGCQIFGVMGSFSGIGQSTSNACIAYDRYMTIAHPLDGKLTRGKGMLMVLFIIAYATPWAVLPCLEIFGRFVPEGFLTQCTFDYISDTDNVRIFVGTIFVFAYVFPMTLIIYFYSQIVSHVVNHEKSLREQAKKMNVESLRSNQNQQAQSAEIRIAKAAITICFLFVASWTPYAVVALIGAFGNKALLTPAVTMIPACACKTVACIDPYVYAISHPRYRVELNKRLPFLRIQESPPPDTSSQATETTGTTPS